MTTEYIVKNPSLLEGRGIDFKCKRCKKPFQAGDKIRRVNHVRRIKKFGADTPSPKYYCWSCWENIHI
jgi:hypothetical protein